MICYNTKVAPWFPNATFVGHMLKHLLISFFHYPYAIKIWKWPCTTLNSSITIDSKEDVWPLCNKSLSPQASFIIKAAIVFTFFFIWLAQNMEKYQGKALPLHISIVKIITQITIIENNPLLHFFLLYGELQFI